MSSSLHGVRILDATTGLAGGLAARLLAEAGASVTRLDSSLSDAFRKAAPLTFGIADRSAQPERLTLPAPGDQDALARLVGDADVVMHDLAPADEVAYGFDRLEAAHPRLIVASCPAYPDQTTQACSDPSELLVQAWIGMCDEQASVTGEPMFHRMPVCSVSAGYLLAIGVVSHLVARQKTGHGGRIDTSVLQGALLTLSLYWQQPSAPPPTMRLDSLRKHGSPTALGIFLTGDGEWLHVMGGFPESPPVLETLAEANAVHLMHVPVSPENVEEWRQIFLRRPRQEWLELLWGSDVPCMPILRRGELLRTEQARANGASVRITDVDGNSTWQSGQPFEVALAPSSASPAARPAEVADDTGGPLAGLRVLDFGQYVAGPFSAQLLADLGADVVKIESLAGDPARKITQFLACSRGKRSLALDLKDPRSRVVVQRLVQGADIVIHNLRDRAAVPFGLDWASLREVNPDVVLGTVTAYGRRGPWQGLPGYDPMAQALSGWEFGGVPAGHRPMYMRNSVMDTHAGCALALGALVGLHARNEAGGSAFVDSSLLSIAAFSECGAVVGDDDEPVVELPIDDLQTGVSWDHRIYEAQDGWLAIAGLTDAHRQAVLDVLEAAEPSDLEARIAKWKRDELVERLRAADVPCERVARDNSASFLAAELERASGVVVRTTGAFGVVEQPGPYWRSSFGRVSGATLPSLGEHTIDVLSELGFTSEEIAGLTDGGTVSVPSGAT